MSGDIVPATRNWSAAEVSGADGRFIRVTGEVERGSVDARAELLMSEPPPADLRILSFDLAVTATGEPVPPMQWAPVDLRQRTFPGAYARVRVLWRGVELADLPL